MKKITCILESAPESVVSSVYKFFPSFQAQYSCRLKRSLDPGCSVEDAVTVFTSDGDVDLKGLEEFLQSVTAVSFRYYILTKA